MRNHSQYIYIYLVMVGREMIKERERGKIKEK